MAHFYLERWRVFIPILKGYFSLSSKNPPTLLHFQQQIHIFAP